MWLVIGLAIGGVLVGLELWTRNQNIAVTWYDRLIGAIGLLLIIAAAQHYAGSLAELYPFAGMMGALIIGIPGLILVVVAWQLIARRQRAAG